MKISHFTISNHFATVDVALLVHHDRSVPHHVGKLLGGKTGNQMSISRRSSQEWMRESERLVGTNVAASDTKVLVKVSILMYMQEMNYLYYINEYFKAIKSVYFDWFVWSNATQLTRSNYESDIFNS